MSEMVERVARALAKKMRNSATVDNGDLGHVIVDDLFDMRYVARAAIAAMREPTEAMLDAGWGPSDLPSDKWRAMVSEALK